MLLAGSDYFHVISDCFDSFLRDLHAFRNCPPPKTCQVVLFIMKKIASFGREFSVDQIHSGGEGHY